MTLQAKVGPVEVVGLLLLFFTFSSPGCQASDCCETKEVGGILYQLSHIAEDKFGNCYDTCIYTKNQDNSTTFCFGPGDDVPFCRDPTTAGPTTTTTTQSGAVFAELCCAVCGAVLCQYLELFMQILLMGPFAHCPSSE